MKKGLRHLKELDETLKNMTDQELQDLLTIVVGLSTPDAKQYAKLERLVMKKPNIKGDKNG